jgi:hypothetical protein
MQTLLIKLSEDCRLISKESLADTSASSTSVLSPTIQTKLENINEYCKKLGYTIEFLMSELMENLVVMKNFFILMDYIMFAAQFLLSYILFKGLWKPFVRNLEDRIWRA